MAGLKDPPTVARRLEEHAIRVGEADCKVCGGLGIIYEPFGGGPKRGDFALCTCLEKKVRAPDPPYEYYDEKTGAMALCPAGPARIAIEQIRALTAQAKIPPRYQGYYLSPSIDAASDRGDDETVIALDNAIESIVRFGENRPQPYGQFVHGPPGSGKTHLACIVLNEIIRLYRKPVLFAKIHRDVLSKVKSSFNTNSEFYGEGKKIETELSEVPVLVIDDLGVTRLTDFESQLLYDLIDSRYDYNRLTIITSNDPMDAFKEMAGGRVVSRLREMCREVPLMTADHRLRHAL